MEWPVVGEVSIVDRVNGFSLVKSSNEIECNQVFEGQPSFIDKQIYSL